MRHLDQSNRSHVPADRLFLPIFLNSLLSNQLEALRYHKTRKPSAANRMPYESFKCSHHVSIRGLVQDRRTGSWRYLIQVKRIMQDETSTSFTYYEESEHAPNRDSFSALQRSPSSFSRARWQRRSSSSFATASPRASQVYNIRRSFSEFKLLHAAMKPLMGKHALPNVPADSIFAFFVGETQTMLQKKRLALENILIAIENHSAASDSSEYLEFLAKTNTYDQVSRAPVSPSSISYSFASSCAGTSPSSTALKSIRSFQYESHKVPDHPPVLDRPRSQQKRRRQSVEAKSIAGRENQVDFNRYSLV